MRLISRIDIKNEFVIKGIHLEGNRKFDKHDDLLNRVLSFLQ
ncbi:hypothetical protein OAO45_03830 [Flavobacteriaceae bacterium]|nr:hypothetical protein [Flavobacteriaceae bacterium]